MPERIVFILSTGRTGTKTLAEGLAGDEILSPHQPPHSRLLTIASNYYLHGWLPRRFLEWLVSRLREPQIFQAECRFYIQVFSLDYLPAQIISQKYDNVYIIHMVRDPRTFVPSYLNWVHTRFKSFVANKLIVGWHPSGFFTHDVSWEQWRRMDEFERVCWHWVYKNSLLERMFVGNENYLRIRFEDLFALEGWRVLESALTFAGVPYQKRFESMLQQGKNRSRKSYFLTWEMWKPEHREKLLHICGKKMKQYGYR